MTYLNRNIMLGLLGVVLFQANLSYSMDLGAYNEFKNAILEGNIDQIKSIIQSGLDVNYKSSNVTLIYPAIERAVFSCHNNQSNCGTRLQIIELLIQAGARINDTIITINVNYTALESAMTCNEPSLPVIRLLLGYGAKITEGVLDRVSKKRNKEEIAKILTHHKTLIEQAQTLPTEGLLMEAIDDNRPYIVQLITDKDPALVTISAINNAKVTCPASVLILTRTFEIAKFREFAMERELPVELRQYIEKFAAPNK